jgi:hypothetical protein
MVAAGSLPDIEDQKPGFSLARHLGAPKYSQSNDLLGSDDKKPGFFPRVG